MLENNIVFFFLNIILECFIWNSHYKVTTKRLFLIVRWMRGPRSVRKTFKPLTSNEHGRFIKTKVLIPKMGPSNVTQLAKINIDQPKIVIYTLHTVQAKQIIELTCEFTVFWFCKPQSCSKNFNTRLWKHTVTVPL